MSDGFTSVTGGINFKFEKEGDSVTGYYIGRVENQGEKKNSTIYTLRGEDGVDNRFWGSFIMDDAFDNIPLGTMSRVVYTGMKQGKSNKYHTFDIQQNTSVAPYEGLATTVAEAEAPTPQPTDNGNTAPAVANAKGADDLPF